MRKLLVATVFFALAVCFIASSCNDSGTEPNIVEYPTDQIVEKFEGVDFYPNDVGSQWTYDVYNWFTENWDSVVVTITGTQTLTLPTGTFEATVWEYKWPYKTETQMVVEVEDTVFVYKAGGSYPIAKYVFPLEDGASWTYRHAYGTATTNIIYTDTCSSAHTMHRHCYHYYTDVEGVPFDDHSYYYGWLAPNTGMVRGARVEEFNYSIVSYDNWVLFEYER